jgi:hypothetical protein
MAFEAGRDAGLEVGDRLETRRRRMVLRVRTEKKFSTALSLAIHLPMGSLLVDGDDGVGRRVHVEADDVLDLGGQGRIVGLLEGADTMGLQSIPARCAAPSLATRRRPWPSAVRPTA